MATILTAGNSEGSRRCDATCHNAREESCACICGGRYHGAGDQAQRMLTDDVLAGRLGPELQTVAVAIAMQETADRGPAVLAAVQQALL